MGPIDIIIIVAVALIVVGIIAYLIYNKVKGKSVGCDCGCSSCPHAGACGGGEKEQPTKKEDSVKEENTNENA